MNVNWSPARSGDVMASGCEHVGFPSVQRYQGTVSCIAFERRDRRDRRVFVDLYLKYMYNGGITSAMLPVDRTHYVRIVIV